MAIRTYLYRPLSLTASDLAPLLAGGATPVVGDPLPDSQVPITLDDIHKEDLDDAMSSFGYVYVGEYTGAAPLVSRSDFGVLAADPTGVTPVDGDMYYNSALGMEMRYDAFRSKWLSVESSAFIFGRDGKTKAGQYYRTADERVMSPTKGWFAIRSGTVVSLGYTRKGVAAATFEIMTNGVPIGVVASAATGGRSVSLNGAFTFGQVLAVQNQLGGSDTEDVVGWLRVKWQV